MNERLYVRYYVDCIPTLKLLAQLEKEEAPYSMDNHGALLLPMYWIMRGTIPSGRYPICDKNGQVTLLATLVDVRVDHTTDPTPIVHAEVFCSATKSSFEAYTLDGGKQILFMRNFHSELDSDISSMDKLEKLLFPENDGIRTTNNP